MEDNCGTIWATAAVFNPMSFAASNGALRNSTHVRTAELNKRVQQHINKLNQQNISYERICLTGNIAEKILDYASTNNVDMIVMGSSNRLKGISKIKALGSVTRGVSELANCPVLIVH